MLRAPPQKRSQAGTQTYQEGRADNALSSAHHAFNHQCAFGGAKGPRVFQSGIVSCSGDRWAL